MKTDLEPQIGPRGNERGRPKLRAAFCVDGFNLCHAVAELGQPHLKWLDFAALARRLVAGKPHDVARIVFCTALRTDAPGQQSRHRTYLRALEARGVHVERGYFAAEDRSCWRCGNVWEHPTEKEGDVSLALAICDDAYQNVFDVAYLVTADGDQAPTARLIARCFPAQKASDGVLLSGKELYTVAPPKRSHSYKNGDAAACKPAITEEAVEDCLLPRALPDKNGNFVVRPPEYDPPPGWVPPRKRPGKRRDRS